ncbi:MAG: hypothetical protein Q7I94_01025 [Candidatus Contubernalis sp.]|nr:hypothetical protein [Candidatus Contubernalis sp.]
MLNTIEKLQDLYKNRPWSMFLVLVTLGTMIFFFMGCGSDSTPGRSVKEEKAKTSSTPTAKQSQAPAMVLMGGKGGSEAGKMGDIKKGPERKSVQIPGITTLEEMEARNAAAVKMMRSPGVEFNGLTREEMEKRNAAAAKMARSLDVQVIPGVNLEEMKKRNAAAIEMARSMDVQVMPGVNLQEMKKRNAAALANAPKKTSIQGKREISQPTGEK